MTKNNIYIEIRLILTAPYIHIHILFGFLNVSLDVRCNVKTQFLRHGEWHHGRADHFSLFLPVKKI